MRDRYLSAAEKKLDFGLWEFNIQTGHFSYSAGLSRLLGISSDAVVLDLTILQSMVHPVDRKEGWIASFKADPTERETSFRIIRPDNTVRHLRATMVPTCDLSGNLTKLLAVVLDNSARVLKEKELIRSSRMAKFVRESVEGFVLRVSTGGQIVDGSDVFQHVGQDIDAAVTSVYEIVETDDRGRLQDLMQSSIETGLATRGPIKFAQSNGAHRTYNVTISIDPDVRNHEITYLIFANPLNFEAATASPKTLLDAKQIRAARTILDWSIEEFSERIGLSSSTIRRVEVNSAVVKRATLKKIEATFEAHGVKFENENGRKIVWLDADLKASL